MAEQEATDSSINGKSGIVIDYTTGFFYPGSVRYRKVSRSHQPESGTATPAIVSTTVKPSKRRTK